MKTPFIDHILIIIKDAKKTADFYSRIFGLPMHQDEESVVWQFGNTKLFFSTPFKEVESNFFDRNRIGLNHIAWGVETLEELQEWGVKLNDLDVENSGIIKDKYQDREYIWFDDPDGIRQEFYLRSEK